MRPAHHPEEMRTLPEAPTYKDDHGRYHILSDTCAYPPCGRPRTTSKSTGQSRLCVGHRRQWTRYKCLRPLLAPRGPQAV